MPFHHNTQIDKNTQIDLWAEDHDCLPELPQDCELMNGFLQSRGLEIHKVFRILQEEIAWESHSIMMAGKKVQCPRLSYWMGEAVYSYSGTSFNPYPWHPLVFQIKEMAEEKVGARFNSVLMNYYRNGQDYMGFHRDDEVELGDEPLIASISLGVTRDFVVQSKDERWKIPLEEDSFFLMKGQFQKLYKHGLPKRLRINEPRINLTYRLICPK